MLQTHFVDARTVRPLVLGIAGVAGSGKDTFFQCLKRHLDIKRYSFGDILKEEVKDECLEKFNIDPTNCNREEKDKIRDFLVEYGKEKRKASDGRYFVDRLSHKIKTEGFDNKNICITDVRYADYDHDETYFIQKELKGFLVYVKKHKFSLDGQSMTESAPANEEEERNDPKLKKAYDYIVDWEHVYGSSELEIQNLLNFHVTNFMICLERDLKAKKIKISLH